MRGNKEIRQTRVDWAIEFSRALGIGLLVLLLVTPVAWAASDDVTGPSDVQRWARRQLPKKVAAPLSEKAAKASLARLPILFEPNRGQFDPRVKFRARQSGYALFLTGDEVVVSLPQRGASERKSGWASLPGGRAKTATVRMKLVGANLSPEVAGLEEAPAKLNYIRGNDPAKWTQGVSAFKKVVHRDVYPGVDLYFYGKQRLEYDFVVHPGADPRAIRWDMKGVRSLSVNGEGDLVAKTSSGDLVQRKPVIYQQTAEGRKRVTGGYRVKGFEVSFRLGRFDSRLPLVIDPVLTYSTYFGGSGEDVAHGIAVGSGATYLTGTTGSADFPTTSPFQATYGTGGDAFITKLNSAGSAVDYSTYLGGGGEDEGHSIAVDSSGNAYVAGHTGSTDFPTSAAFQGTFGGGTADAFVTKINSSGSALTYSTYLGGTGEDKGRGVSVDSSGNAFVSGYTGSTNFPVASAQQSAFAGGVSDAFVTKINSSGSALTYSTYLGGAGDDFGHGISLDSLGSAHVAGITRSPNFPVTPGALRPVPGGNFPLPPTPIPDDGFVSKLTVSGAALAYSTYLGGASNDRALGIAVDGLGKVYVTGTTQSPDFPTTLGAFQTSPGSVQDTEGVFFPTRGFHDAFVTKLDPGGVGPLSLAYSTFLGGSGLDEGDAIAVNSSGSAFVTGGTFSRDFPTRNPFQATRTEGGTCSFLACDAFVTRLNAEGSRAVYSSYLGGTGIEEEVGFAEGHITIDADGAAYLAGKTRSTDFPTQSPLQSSNAGLRDAYVVKVAPFVKDPWRTTGSLSLPRFGHTATRLSDGTVMVAGGCAVPSDAREDTCPAHSASTEIYDPTTETWLPAGPMSTPRISHSATLLANGQVLVAGGCTAPTDQASCQSVSSSELFNPITRTWTPAGPMITGRRLHTATLLSSGKVLVAGGREAATSLSSSELFDPTTLLWSSAGSLGQARSEHSATRLSDGKVLAAGGSGGAMGGGALSSAELFDPGTGVWSATGALGLARFTHTATILGSGKVLVAGGSSGAASLSSSELYDPAAATWSATGSMSRARSTHAAAALNDGRVLATGGRTGPGAFPAGLYLAPAEIYDPSLGAWSAAGNMLRPRSGRRALSDNPLGLTATTLQNGKVLVAGGNKYFYAELFRPNKL